MEKPQTTNAVISVFMGNTVQDAKQLRYDQSYDLLIPAMVKFTEEHSKGNIGMVRRMQFSVEIESWWYKLRNGDIGQAAYLLSELIKKLPESHQILPNVKLVADPDLTGTNRVIIETEQHH
jgi:hypothetical protein